jgi:hypothetical protein
MKLITPSVAIAGLAIQRTFAEGVAVVPVWRDDLLIEVFQVVRVLLDVVIERQEDAPLRK